MSTGKANLFRTLCIYFQMVLCCDTVLFGHIALSCQCVNPSSSVPLFSAAAATDQLCLGPVRALTQQQISEVVYKHIHNPVTTHMCGLSSQVTHVCSGNTLAPPCMVHQLKPMA